MSQPKIGLLCLAGGRGTRFGEDKSLCSIAGAPLLYHTLAVFATISQITHWGIVVQDAAHQAKISRDVLSLLPSHPPIFWAYAGETRQRSALNGLLALEPESLDFVLIHDAARACVTPEAVEKVIAATQKHSAAILANRITDTLRRTHTPFAHPKDLDLLHRENLWAAQTPQGFGFKLVLEASKQGLSTPVTDDAALVSLAGHPIFFVENTEPNPKLTTPGDLQYVEHLLRLKNSANDK